MVLWTEARVWFYGQKHVSHTNIFERGEYICPQSYAVRKHDKLIGENTKVGNKIISYNYYKSVCVPHTCKTVKVNIVHISVSFVWHFSFVVVGFNLNKSWKKFQQTCLRAGWNWLTQLFMRWKTFKLVGVTIRQFEVILNEGVPAWKRGVGCYAERDGGVSSGGGGGQGASGGGEQQGANSICDVSQLVRQVETILGKPREGEGKKVAALRLLLIEAGRHALTTEVRIGSDFALHSGLV